MKKKQTAKAVDLRTRAGRTLKRKRAAMARARKARWAHKRAPFKVEVPVTPTLTAKEVIASLPPITPEILAEFEAKVDRMLEQARAITRASAPRAYTREVPR